MGPLLPLDECLHPRGLAGHDGVDLGGDRGAAAGDVAAERIGLAELGASGDRFEVPAQTAGDAHRLEGAERTGEAERAIGDDRDQPQMRDLAAAGRQLLAEAAAASIVAINRLPPRITASRLRYLRIMPRRAA